MVQTFQLKNGLVFEHHLNTKQLGKWHTLISKDTSGFMSNTLSIRFPIMLSVYIVYRMHKVERRMVKTNSMNTQGDKIKAILL